MDSKSAVIGILVRRDKDIATEETGEAHVVTGRNQSDAAASQGLPKIVSSHWKGGERHGQVLLYSLQEAAAAAAKSLQSCPTL